MTAKPRAPRKTAAAKKHATTRPAKQPEPEILDAEIVDDDAPGSAVELHSSARTGLAPRAVGDTIYLQMLRAVTGYGAAGDTIQLVESLQTEAMVTNGLAVVVSSPTTPVIAPAPTSIRWQPYTRYPAAWVVVNPSGQIVSANTDFVSGGSYSAGNWTVINDVGAGGGGGVTTFQGRAGAVTLTKVDVTGTSLAAGDVGALADLTDRSSSASETVPAGRTTNATTAGVTLTAPAPAGTVGTPPQRFAVRNASTGAITISYPDSAGTTQNLTVLAGEVLTFRQKTTSGYAAESGNKPLAQLDSRYDASGTAAAARPSKVQNLAGGRAIVANRPAYTSNYNIGNAQGTSRVRHVATQACSDVRLVYAAPLWNETTSPNQTQLKVGLEKTATVTTLSSALSTGSPITSLPVVYVPVTVASGTIVTVTSGGNTQAFTLSAQAAIGATALTVTSATPNFAYPIGSTVTQQTIHPATFGGRATGTLDANGVLVPDPIGVELAAGEVFWSRCFGNTPMFNAGSNTAYVTSAASTSIGATGITSNTLIPNPAPGQTVTIDSGGNAETAVLANPAVTGSSAPYTYNFTTTLTKAHASGITFGQQPYANGTLYSDLGEGFTNGTDLSWSTTAVGALGAISTTIVGTPSAGASTFQVAGPIPGSTLTIGTAGTQETVTVKNYQGTANPYTVTITGTLAFSHTAGETVVSNLTGSLGIIPACVVADRVTATALPAVVGVGDSIPNGTGNPRPGQSYFTLAFDTLTPYISVTKAGEIGATFVNPAGSPLRRRMLDLATWAYIEYGTNDIYNGLTLAQMQATMQALCLIAKQRGLKVAAQTLTPRTSSTDLWVTASNQTVASSGFNTVRTQYNDWLRAYASNGLQGTYVDLLVDMAAGMEVNSAGTLTLNGGLWLADASGPHTADGIHPSLAGHAKMATLIPVASFT